MEGKIILNLAISLDGFIADENGGFDWILGQNDKSLDTDKIHFISNDVVTTILNEKKSGKNIYLFGGGISIDSFIKRDIIDEYRIGIIPVILGKGRPLFLKDNPTISLHLESYALSDGVITMNYTKRHK